MKTVGAYEAKTHLPRLLDEVARGETITITKHGVPVARLIPPEPERAMDFDALLAALRDLRRQVGSLSRHEIREMIEEGRA